MLIVNVLLIVIVLYLLWCLMKKESFGAILDDACLEGDCSTPEGIAAAVAKCKQTVQDLPNYMFIKNACENPDPIIRDMGCPEPCDIKTVPDFVIKKIKSECVPNTRKLNSNDGLYYCQSSTGAGWMVDPVQEEAMTKEEVEQKEKFLYY